MKAISYKKTLICGTLSLCLLGEIPHIQAASEPNVSVAAQQTEKVTGVVSDAAGTIIGASVLEKGTTNGTITDMDGRFELNVKPGAVLLCDKRSQSNQRRNEDYNGRRRTSAG